MKPKEYIRAIPAMWAQRKFLGGLGVAEVKAENLVVSLTSFPKRFRGLPYVLSSLINQSVRPSKVVLWVDKGTKKLLPPSVYPLTEYGLEIHEAEHAYKSYLKLLPTLKLYPEADVVTADDDLIYSKHWLENLVGEAREGESGVHAYVTRTIGMTGNRELSSYAQWSRDSETAREGGAMVMPLGFAGVYYPAGTFSNEVFNAEVFQSLAPHADDLWFKVMTLLADKKSYKAKASFGREIYLPWTQHLGLKKLNVHQNENQTQMESLLNHYDLWGKLQEDVSFATLLPDSALA